MSLPKDDEIALLAVEPPEYEFENGGRVSLPEFTRPAARTRSNVQRVILQAAICTLTLVALWLPFILAVRFYKYANAWPEMVLSHGGESRFVVGITIGVILLIFVTPLALWVTSGRTDSPRAAATVKGNTFPWFVYAGWALGMAAAAFVIFGVGGAEQCSITDDYIVLVTAPRLATLPVVAHMYKSGRQIITFALEQNGTSAFTLGVVHDPQNPPFSITYDLANGVSSCDNDTASFRSDSVGTMDVSLADGMTMSLLAEGNTVRDLSLYGGGEIVLRTAGTAPASCRTIKMCTVQFPLSDAGRRAARVLFPLGLAMYRHAEQAADC